MVLVEERMTTNEGAQDIVEEGIQILNLTNKKTATKTEMRRIEICELPSKLPDFKNSVTTKDNILAEWLISWIESSLKSGKIKANDLLPKKSALASHLGISIGTVQTAIRFIEDKRYVESKQRIGTFIRDINEPDSELRKQTSKREQAIVALKKVFIKNSYKVGEQLPSSRELSKIIGSAPNTTRLALEYLAGIGIISANTVRGNKSSWSLREVPRLTDEEVTDNEINLESDTLVNQVERDLKQFISEKYQVGDKLPSHFQLADILKVSIKTVHDAMKRLSEQGILQSKRGRYGTAIMRIPSDNQLNMTLDSIFAPAIEASFYNYEKVEKHLKHFIKENFAVGDKIPAMGKLASELNVSSNTIRKALQRLAAQNIVTFSRGRYGGTFVQNMPSVEKEESGQFTWLSINPEHSVVYQSKK